MSLTKVNGEFYFTCLSSDISDNKVSGASIIGARLYTTDTKAWYVVQSDLTLAVYNAGLVNVNTLPPSEEHLGQVGGHSDIIDYTLVLDTAQYASGDVMSIGAAFTAVRVNGGKALPLSIQVVDEDDQGQALDLLFFRTITPVGTINQPFSIDDAGSRELLGWVKIATTDWTDWGGFRTANIKSSDAGWYMGLWETASDSRSLFVASISRGTGTYTATGVKLKISVLQD